MLRNNGFTVAFIIWMVLLTGLSLIDLTGLEATGLQIPMGDKLIHFTWYFIAALLGMLFLREQTGGWLKIGLGAIVIIAFLTIYGIIIEVLQVVLSDVRSGEYIDALANTVGAISGVLLIIGGFSLNDTRDWKI